MAYCYCVLKKSNDHPALCFAFAHQNYEGLFSAYSLNTGKFYYLNNWDLHFWKQMCLSLLHTVNLMDVTILTQ